MNTLFLHFLTFARPIGYILVFLGMMVEGDLFLLSTSFLTKQGFFDIFDFMWAVLLGTIAGDLIWYWLGYKFGGSANKISSYIQKRLSKININFENKFFMKLLLSKFMYGSHHVAVAYLGTKKINFIKYLKAELPATLIWIIIIGVLGYVFGALFALVKEYLKFVELALLILILLYIFISRKLKCCKFL